MPKPPPGHEPDPMARVVDRLLAQLPSLQAEPVFSSSSSRPSVTVGSASPARRSPEITSGDLLGVWLRVLLGLSLGMMMAGWPYSRACGLPLFGYLSAVTTVMLAGIWGATASWKFRSSLAHVVSLILVLYAITLATAEFLPRTGYAVDQSTWLCAESDPLMQPQGAGSPD